MKKFRIIYESTNIEIPSGPFDIGRSDECHLTLDDPSISRVHATLVHENGKLFILDRGSRNGCTVNNVKVVDRIELKDGDRVQMGHQSIRIKEIERIALADNTMGLSACHACGAWVSSSEPTCSMCGASTSTGKGVSKSAKETQNTIRMDVNPIDLAHSQGFKGPMQTKSIRSKPQMMLVGLIKKSVSLQQFDKAHQLLNNLMESYLKKDQENQAISNEELEQIIACVKVIAEAEKSPKIITTLFSFYRTREKLMPRDTVDALYKLVRIVGYRVCPEMTKYLALLEKKSQTFTPGEKFIHRRLDGLKGMCS